MAQADSIAVNVEEMDEQSLELVLGYRGVLGGGGFSQVVKARHHRSGRDVAVKILIKKDGSSSEEDLQREVKLMLRADSPHVMKLLGVFRSRTPPHPVGLVMDLMERGSLYSLQHLLPWPLVFRLAHQVALGMKHLHSLTPALIHKDLKPDNILLDTGLNVKITDFGLAKFDNTVTCIGLKTVMSAFFAPPEAIYPSPSYTADCAYDIYSYAILVWTILNPGHNKGVNDSSIPRPSLEDVNRLETPGLEDLVELMVYCWNKNPSLRPRFTECTTVTEGLYEEYKCEINSAVRQVQSKLDGDSPQIVSPLPASLPSVSPVNDSLPSVPPVNDSLPSVPPVNDSLPSVPPVNDSLPSVPPVNDSLPSVPPVNDSLPSVPPGSTNRKDYLKLMDFIDPIFGIATTLYALCEEVKANKKRCTRLKDRVKGLEPVLRAIQGKRAQISPDSKMYTALKELTLTLKSAADVVKKYNADTKSIIKRFWNTYNYGDEFESLNDRLIDAFQVLSLNLPVQMDPKLFDADSQRKEYEAARKKDHEEIQKMLQHVVDQKDTVEGKLDAMSLKPDDMKQMIEMLQKSEIIPEGIRKIIPGDLTFDFPITPIMKTDICEVYKGEYRKYPVAIKRYLCPQITIPGEVIKIFEREIATMMNYASPHILRMFGVCFEGADGQIVMEYCAKGSLREVLDNNLKCKLPWVRKARMCLDAAQGIYRLHQSEQKAKVHGSITSDKFMVAEGYRVKLGGLELAQTETSLRRSPKGPKKCGLRYRSPEELDSVNHPYCKICEIYSLGMVLWEIATCKKPLDDCTTDLHIFKRVCVEKRVLEPLPEDCPKKLRELINACRGYNPFQRPTAGVLVDKLRQVVEQLEEE